MVICLAFGDPHFKVGNAKECLLLSERAVALVKKYHPDFVILMGDELDRFETVHTSPLTRLVELVHQLSLLTTVIILVGNHDLPNNSLFMCQQHAFTAMKYWGPSVVVVDKVQMHTFGGLIFCFSPYVPPGRFQEALDTCPGWRESKAIFCHQEFYGAKMGAVSSLIGDRWGPDLPFVISGHIHDYDRLASNILYIGTPFQHAFGDREGKTISHFTFSDQNPEPVEQRMDLGIPRKLIVELLPREVPSYELPENANLKIIIIGTTPELKAITKLPKIGAWKKLGIKLFLRPLPSSVLVANSNNQGYKRIPYAQALYNNISHNPHLKQVYVDLFGTPSGSQV